MSYNPGDVVRVSTSPGFTDEAGDPADPSVVTLSWKVGRAGTVTTYTRNSGGPDTEIVRDGVGTYHADLAVTAPGVHYFRWVGTGAVASAEEGTFSVTTYFP